MRASDDEENIDTLTGGSGSIPSWRAPKYRDPKRKNQFLIRAKYILLTYSQVDEDEINHNMIHQRIVQMGGRCRIGREIHKDGGIHYHAFCVKEKRFISRDPRRFDINGFHPNIEQILRTPENAWAYVAKDGNLVVDELPDPPVSRSKSARKQEVWNTAPWESRTPEQAYHLLAKEDPKRALCSFNSIYPALKHLIPTNQYIEYTPPPGLAYELDAYPEIAGWQQRYLGQYTAPEVNTNQLQESSSSETDSVYSGESGNMASSGTSQTSISALFGEDCELSRYEAAATLPSEHTTPLKLQQHRPKCLVIIGPSRLGKTLVARSFGKHSYFHGNWNVEQYNPDALYNIFDDIKGQLSAFDFRSFLGAQHDITVTDKYHKKKTIKNGKPAIYLSNKDPLTTRHGREDRDWLKANCIFVYVTTPICNIAREALERDQLEDAMMYFS